MIKIINTGTGAVVHEWDHSRYGNEVHAVAQLIVDGLNRNTTPDSGSYYVLIDTLTGAVQ